MNEKVEYLELVEKVEKIKEKVISRMQDVAEVFNKHALLDIINNVDEAYFTRACLATCNEISALLLNSSFADFYKSKQCYILHFCILEHTISFNLDVWEDSLITISSIVAYGDDEEFKQYLKELEDKIAEFLNVLKRIEQEEREKRIIFDEEQTYF